MVNYATTLQEPVSADAEAVRFAAMPADASLGTWWVVHTKSRQEKALAEDLRKRGINHFLPLVTVNRKVRQQVIQRELPLFPLYLFLCGAEEARYAAMSTHRVANIIQVFNQETFKKELRQIHRLVTSQMPVDLYPGIKAGKLCRIISGPLAGVEGVVLRCRDMCRVYIKIDVLGQSAEVEIAPALLEVVE